MSQTLGVLELPSAGNGLADRPGAAAREFLCGPENALAESVARRLLAESASRTDLQSVEIERETYFDGPEAHPAKETAAFDGPIVFYGPSGVGKSHLVHALADAWLAARPQAAIVRLAAGEFADELTAAVRGGALVAWRQRIRSADLLLVEDLDRLAGRRSAQQELWYTLDALADVGGTAWLTARALPSQLRELIPGLRSRLAACLVVPMLPPTPATRRAIMQRLAAARGLNLPAATVHALADHVAGPVDSLAGALASFQTLARAEGRALDAELVEQLLGVRPGREAPSLRAIATETVKYFHLKLADLKSPSRRQSIVAARGVVIYLARLLTDKSLQEIGRYLGGRDHTTVLNGYRRIQRLSKRDPALRVALAELQERLEQR